VDNGARSDEKGLLAADERRFPPIRKGRNEGTGVAGNRLQSAGRAAGIDTYPAPLLSKFSDFKEQWRLPPVAFRCRSAASNIDR
jgi:hypothetical protein